MAYKNLIGIACADRGEVFKRLRDFVCKRNGSYDYSLTGIGWTLFDSFYTTDQNTISINDWFVVYSPGESGNEDLYFRVTFVSNYLKIEGFLYWDAVANVGVQQYNTLANWYMTDALAPVLWVYGDLDFVLPVHRESTTSSNFYVTPFGKAISLYNDVVATSAAALPAAAGVIIDVGTVPVGAGWVVGKKLFIRDTAKIDIITITAVSATTVTADLAFSYLAGAKLSADIAYYVSTGYQVMTAVNCLIAHNGAKSITVNGFSNDNAVATNCSPDSLNADHIFQNLHCSAPTYGYLGIMRHVLKGPAAGLTNLDITAHADGNNYRVFSLMSGMPILIKEV